MSKVTVNEVTVSKVQDSWEIVLQIPNCTQVVGELLFRNIFKIAPGAHKMFPFGKDYDEVCDKMFQGRHFKKHAKNVVSMLDSAVQFLGPDLTELEEILVNLGALHVGYGILPEHYPIVGQALLETLAIGLGDQFTGELKEAWAGVYGFITTSMLRGANESLLRYKIPLFGNEKKELTLDDYVSRMLPGQTELYYVTMTGNSISTGNFRQAEKLQQAYELQQAGVAILHIAKNKEDLIKTNLQKYLGRKMVDVVGGEIDASFLEHIRDINHEIDEMTNNNHTTESVTALYQREGLTAETAADFCAWFQTTLGPEKVKACTPTCDFASQPARVIADESESPQIQQLETMKSLQVDKKHVEINPQHPLIVEIQKARVHHAGLAQLLAAQVYDNCLINAGLLQDFRLLVTRINDLSLALLQETNKSALVNATSTATATAHPTVASTAVAPTTTNVQPDNTSSGSKSTSIPVVVSINNQDMSGTTVTVTVTINHSGNNNNINNNNIKHVAETTSSVNPTVPVPVPVPVVTAAVPVPVPVVAEAHPPEAVADLHNHPTKDATTKTDNPPPGDQPTNDTTDDNDDDDTAFSDDLGASQSNGSLSAVSLVGSEDLGEYWDD